jgi:cytochrome c5
MSDANNDHESPIKTPQQLIAALTAALLVPIVIIVLVVQYVVNDRRSDGGAEGQSPKAVADAIAKRIRPVADEGFVLKDASGPKQVRSGAEVYKSVCAACHDSGVAGAPKFADAGAWSARIAQGYDTLVSHAFNGIRAMPAKGGNPDLDELDVARAVAHISNAAGAKFKEPEAKAEPAAVPK